MKVLMLSKNFMKGHPRVGEPTGFEDKYLRGWKRHTLRENAKGYYKDGEALSLRQWSGAAYRSKQVEIGRVKRCGVQQVRLSSPGCWGLIFAHVRRDERGRWREISADELARNDGLSVDDFRAWFFPPGGHSSYTCFIGDIVHFTGFRY